MANKTKIKIKTLTAIMIAFFLFLSSSSAVRSQTTNQVNDEIRQLNSQIKNSQDKLSDLQKKKAQYAKSIKEKQSQAASLRNQLSILDDRLATAELDIENTQAEISQVSLEQQKTTIEINDQEQEIAKEKQSIANILKVIYKEGDANTLEILLMNDSLTEFLDRLKYLKDVNSGMSEALDNLNRAQSQLESKQADLEAKNEELANLKNDLEQSKLAAGQEKANKSYILDATKNSEAGYQKLLAEAKTEEANAEADVASLEKTVREKMSGQDKQALDQSENGLAWPISSRIITAYFHDQSYPFKNIFEHPAIDIATAQGTEVRAAASGYVARVYIHGTAYGYIMLIHGNNISTVYGHVTKSFVNEDDYVTQGEVIALSGGRPGTTGSGPFTTGPHLHFEVRKDGIPVNPLDYLP